MRICLIGYLPRNYCAHSGMFPVARSLKADALFMDSRYEHWGRRSWSLGFLLQQWGIRHYGSTWNKQLPYGDEWRWRNRLPVFNEPGIVHFVWGELTSPKRIPPYHRKGARVVVSVHCSPRRWDSVWLRPDGYARADEVVLTSECQRPFVERDVPSERVRTILHGVVADYFTPPANRESRGEKLRLFMLGDTERDHELAARVAAKLPADKFEWRIRTTSPQRSLYEGIPSVNMLPRLSDEEMLEEYRQADVLAMPMLDSAANNVILESMACGTPVMTNRTAGVPEYVAEDCNFVISNDRHVDEWIEKLLWLEQNRDVPEQMRPATRAWAERFDWKIIADEYRKMYRDVLERG